MRRSIILGLATAALLAGPALAASFRVSTEVSADQAGKCAAAAVVMQNVVKVMAKTDEDRELLVATEAMTEGWRVYIQGKDPAYRSAAQASLTRATDAYADGLQGSEPKAVLEAALAEHAKCLGWMAES